MPSICNIARPGPTRRSSEAISAYVTEAVCQLVLVWLGRDHVGHFSNLRACLGTDTPESLREDCNRAVNRSSGALTLMTPINRFPMRELRSADVTNGN